MFRDAYAERRCIVPVDGFFEWRAIKGARAKHPYAIAMKDGSPFGLAGLWENWRNPSTGEWERTFVVITVPSNDLVAQIHDRMPAILKPLPPFSFSSSSEVMAPGRAFKAIERACSGVIFAVPVIASS